MSTSVLIRPPFNLSTSSNKSDVHPVLVFYSLSSMPAWISKCTGRNRWAQEPRERKLAMTAKTTEAFIHACVLLLSLYLWRVLTFTLFSVLLHAAFIFSLVNATFSIWPFISHQRCSAFPSFYINTVFHLQSCFLWQTFEVVLVCCTKNHHNKAEHRQTD